MEQLVGFEAFPFSHEGERRTVYAGEQDRR